MEWVSSWIQGIIIAVIISTIIEMILPEGNSKKYIKVVIGIYILFSIISPVITKITGNDFRVSDIFDLDEYIEASKSSGSLQNSIESENENQIKDIYLNSIRSDIKEKVENKGYTVNSIEIEIANDEQYTLKKLKLQVINKNEVNTLNANIEQSTVNNIETVNEIKVTIQNNTVSNQTKENVADSSDKEAKSSDISNSSKKELKEYLAGVYEISTKNIFINE